jgi:hypothetical protein
MFEHVLAPDVDDEGELRLQRNEVGEVLLRSHAKVHAAGPLIPGELGNDNLKGVFV